MECQFGLSSRAPSGLNRISRVGGSLKMHSVSRSTLLALIILGLSQGSGFCQEKSVRPGINYPFKNPNIKHFTDVFETESREIFAKRKQIVATCKIKSGMVVARVRARTGLVT